MNERGVIAVFAKPPRPGQVKTRLASSVGVEAAASLARAFFDDVWAAVGTLRWARRLLASTTDDLAPFGLTEGEVWLQGSGDLGKRIERVGARALAEAPWFMALGADSPGLPVAAFEAARVALEDHDAVLGPAEDGGYYLIGLKRLEPGLLDGLPWSEPTTFEATRTRLVDRGLTVATIQRWYDVDEPADLERLRVAIDRKEVVATRTAEVMRTLGLR